MAEDAAENAAGEDGGVKCEECVPGLPLWMGTFSDLVTLLLTFFVLLLSFAKTESSKYKAALGSIREAFGGNVKEHGDVVMPGKSPDNAPSMMDSIDDVKPFPIDFLTTEGMLDKHEMNRNSDEDLKEMRMLLKQYDLIDAATLYEMPEGIKVVMKDKIYFEKGSTRIRDINVRVFEKFRQLVKDNNWVIFVQGHASQGETSELGNMDSFFLSSQRAVAVSKVLMKKGIPANKITSVSYGDSRPDEFVGQDLGDREKAEMNRRVEFIIRKHDLSQKGIQTKSL